MKLSQVIQTEKLSAEEMPSLQQDIAGAGGPKSPFIINNDWYEIIIQNAPESFCLVDLKGEILDVNDAFRHMLGYSREGILTMKIQAIDIWFIEKAKNYTQEVLEVRRAGGKSGVVRHRRKDRQIIDVLVSIKYLDIGPGYLFRFHNDITEQERICRQLKESEQR